MLTKRQPVTEQPISLVERLAHHLGASANATAIFAAPVERDGITVIPVAKAKYAFGGGSGQQPDEEGSGGGGGVIVTPVGYIEIAEGVTRYRPIRDSFIWLPLMATAIATGGVLSLLLVREARKLLRH